MAFGESCVKFYLSGANFTISLGGLALLIVGILYKVNFSHYTDAIPDDYQSIGLAPVLTIIVGSIIFVIAFFGCCGAFRESSCMLTTYAVILLIIFFMQIAIGIFVMVEVNNEDTFKTKVESAITKVFTPVIQNTDNTTKELVDLIQKEFKCCGIKSSSDWTTPPDTCYSNQNSTGTLYTQGCAEAFYEFLENSLKIIGIVILTLSSLEIIGSIFSLCLSSSIKNRERRFRY
ncbi:CD63 antigen-like isoform X2 [Diorhabda carinulata]|uniref:CD63 antigen-like isoform X2 n=1 Tax=Diorhabda sublineata TaxID=1163346 RepID=UPI0024E0FEF4|nr:CD63 antigen-like isoform X2 [Diorhabda sublineata]XP_057655804.1 CD63 antigen-like isoform X2 [Diorhabda carinulata]